MKRIAGSFAVLVAAVLGAASSLHAGALDDRVPSDSVMYVGWSGADALAPDYKGSNLKQILDASSVGDFINKQLPGLIAKASENDPDAAKKIAMLQRGLKITWQHPVAFYFCPIDFTNPRKPGFRFGLMCDAGTDAKELNELLAPAVASVPPSSDLPVHLASENNLVLLSFGKVESIADLKAGGALSTAPAYTKAMGQVKQGGQATVFYGDVQKIVAMITDGIAKSEAPAEVKAKVPQVIAALGMNGVTQIAMQGGFQGKGWSERAFVGLSGPRTGLVSLIDGAPIPDEMLAAVPKDAAAFSAGRFDLQKLYGEARKVVTIIEPRALAEMDKGIARANQEFGIDIEKDVIDAIGDQWLMYRAALPEGGMSFTLINKARNGEALAKAIDTVEKLFNEKSGAPIKVEKVKAGKMEVSALMFLQYNIAWTVRNGNLYVSTLNGIAPAVNQVENKAPSILTSDLYKGVMATLAPAGVKPTAITYSHPARLYPELRSLALGVLPLLRAQAHLDIPMDLLPDPSQVSEYMTPGGSITWSDADGLHGVGVSAFPGAALLAGQGTGTTAVVAMTGAGWLTMRATPRMAAQGLP